mmetsp:Transcript_18999/g.42297  ORF Transcript_18999/g.42297 Transcript_18999/m.42297 type:complete len:244 (-) Transcript_18999:533-1264(-)
MVSRSSINCDMSGSVTATATLMSRSRRLSSMHVSLIESHLLSAAIEVLDRCWCSKLPASFCTCSCTSWCFSLITLFSSSSALIFLRQRFSSLIFSANMSSSRLRSSRHSSSSALSETSSCSWLGTICAPPCIELIDSLSELRRWAVLRLAALELLPLRSSSRVCTTALQTETRFQVMPQALGEQDPCSSRCCRCSRRVRWMRSITRMMRVRLCRSASSSARSAQEAGGRGPTRSSFLASAAPM